MNAVGGDGVVDVDDNVGTVEAEAKVVIPGVGGTTMVAEEEEVTERDGKPDIVGREEEEEGRKGPELEWGADATADGACAKSAGPGEEGGTAK